MIKGRNSWTNEGGKRGSCCGTAGSRGREEKNLRESVGFDGHDALTFFEGEEGGWSILGGRNLMNTWRIQGGEGEQDFLLT